MRIPTGVDGVLGDNVEIGTATRDQHEQRKNREKGKFHFLRKIEDEGSQPPLIAVPYFSKRPRFLGGEIPGGNLKNPVVSAFFQEVMVQACCPEDLLPAKPIRRESRATAIANGNFRPIMPT
jgi:hypothetical protein